MAGNLERSYFEDKIKKILDVGQKFLFVRVLPAAVQISPLSVQIEICNELIGCCRQRVGFGVSRNPFTRTLLRIR